MFFRLTYEVNGYQLNFTPGTTLLVDESRNLSVSLHRPLDAEGKPKLTMILLQVLAEMPPPPKAEKALRELFGNLEAADLIRQASATPMGMPFEQLPNTLQDFGSSLFSELADVAIDTFELIRWRLDVTGPVGPYKSLSLDWSDDQENWYVFPRHITLKISATIHRRLSPQIVGELESMASVGAKEPLAHSLLREAVVAANGRSWASALVMAMTALEIGVKDTVGVLAPDAAWLGQNSPSPPVVKMLSEYLPHLRPRLLIADKVLVPTPRLINILKKATTVRNETVHAGKREVNRDLVQDTLTAVSDILWILDFYSGNSWALSRLAPETRVELAIV
jgi:hypothetical protein